MRVDLLGYLLGALDGAAQEKTRQRIASSPRLQAHLAQLEDDLQPLESARWTEKPPLGLAARTSQLITEHAEKSKVQQDRLRRSGVWDRVHRTGWQLFDYVVAAGIFLAASMMFFPAVANSRYLARLNQCQDNLRLFGIALPEWADRASGRIPGIPEHCPKTGVAGIYAPQLLHAGFITEQNRFLCPNSELAQERNRFSIPTVAQVQQAEGDQLHHMHRTMGGSYFYQLGHFERGKYTATRVKGRIYFPVMTDAVINNPLTEVSSSHGSHGINVLFEDGHCQFVVLRPRGGRLAQRPANFDVFAMFINNRGLVEAGLDENDAVLAPSWVRPIPVTYASQNAE